MPDWANEAWCRTMQSIVRRIGTLSFGGFPCPFQWTSPRILAARRNSKEYGRGNTEKSLRHMIRFADVFPHEAVVSALRRELSWTYFKEIIYLDDPLKRNFYAELCRIG
jgi:hypothetical protein